MRSLIITILTLPLVIGQTEFPACPANAQKPAWMLENILYNSSDTYTTPAHHFGSGYVSFSLASNVRNVSAQCNATTSQVPNFFDGNQWYPCKFSDSALPSDQAWFKFTASAAKLEINQTYTCDGAGTLYVTDNTNVA
jgi:hypothetical protein